jgi:hypothetical protein
MRWEIYYDDESVVSDLDVVWEDAPNEGVLFILEYYPDDRKMVHMGMDYYFMRYNTIISCSLADLHTHLSLGFAPNAVKFGRWTSDEIWNRVHDVVFPPN